MALLVFECNASACVGLFELLDPSPFVPSCESLGGVVKLFLEPVGFVLLGSFADGSVEEGLFFVVL